MLIVLAAALLRLPGLGWLPSPAGDEGNWAAYADQAYQGHRVQLQPKHRGASPAFAYLLAGSLRVGGRSYTGLRLMSAVTLPLACLVCFGLLAWAGMRQEGLALAAVLAAHPWSVIWSRTAAVPYALALACLSVAVAAYWAGLLRRSGWLLALGIVLLAAAAHFSPLAIVLVPPCLLLALQREHRWLFGRVWTYVAVAVALAVVTPLLVWMRATRVAPGDDLGLSFPAQLASGAHLLATGVMGEATVRHFTAFPLPVLWSGLGAALLLLLLLLALLRPEVRQTAPGARFSLLLLGCAAIGLPLVLLPARRWFLGTIDAERYVFVLLPGLGLALGALLRARRVWTTALLVLLGLTLGLATGRVLGHLAWGSGVDHGAITLREGRCYRGWLTSGEGIPPVELIRQEAQRVGGPVAVLYEGHELHTLPFVLRGLPANSATFAERRRWQRWHGRFLLVLLAPGVVDPVALPGRQAANQVNRNLVRSDRFTEARLVRTIRQPDGTPLWEVWSAHRR